MNVLKGKKAQTQLTDFDEILAAALTLSSEERALLLELLLKSLDKSEDIESRWADEAQKRMQEIREGLVETIDLHIGGHAS